MAEENTETAEYERWLADLGAADEETAEEEPEAEGEDNLAAVTELAGKVARMEREQQTGAMLDTFKANASASALELLEVYRTGDEDPAQLKRLMELAVNKAKAAELPLTEAAEKQAARIAQDAYGVGPVSGGTPGQRTPEEEFDALAKQARETGDSKLAYQLFRNLPAGAPASPGD